MKTTLFAIALATAGLTAIPLTSHAADQSGLGFELDTKDGRNFL